MRTLRPPHLLTAWFLLAALFPACPVAAAAAPEGASPEKVEITVAPAMIYSFVRDPSFEAKAAGDHFVIQEKKAPYKELSLAAMMLIEPNAWYLNPLRVGIQLGMTPEKQQLGFFLGVSLRTTDGQFTFGAGAAFQQVDRLQGGLAVGQNLATQDLLKTEKNFRTGLYLQVTIMPKALMPKTKGSASRSKTSAAADSQSDCGSASS